MTLRRSAFKSEPKPRKPRTRRCAVASCRKVFEKTQSFVSWCSHECGAIIGMKKLAKKRLQEDRAKRVAVKAERKADKEKLEAHKPLSYWEKIAERHCNAYIRARDPDCCISCGVTQSSAWQAGHYVAVGANSTLRYHPDNIHKQCIKCNMFEGSNAIQYRIGLLAKIGVERVEWLEGWHSPVKMTAEAAKEIAEMYKLKLKELKK